MKGYAKAKAEANTLLDRHIAEVGGDETRCRGMFTVWAMRAIVSGEQRVVKDRSREVKK